MKRVVDFFEIKRYMVIKGRQEKRHIPFEEAYYNVLKQINGGRL